MKINYLKFLVFLGVVMSLFYSITPETVPYFESPTINENFDDDEWNNAIALDIVNATGNVAGVAYLQHDGENLCLAWLAIDYNYSVKDHITITFSSHTYQYYRGTAGTFEIVEEIMWAGETCFPYAELGIVAGETELPVAMTIEIKDYWDIYDADASVFLEGENLWAAPCAGECCLDSDCPGDELCNIEINECAECLDHDDCEGDNICSYGQCVAPGCVVGAGSTECCSNNDCDNSEYCNEEQCLNVPTGDCGYVDNHVWTDYECCNDVDCDSDEKCSNHECVEDEGPTCGGDLKLQLLYKTATNRLKALVSGINYCTGKIIEIRENNCAGDAVCFIDSGSQGGNCEFDAPTEAGTYMYSACVDLDGDGAKEFDKEVYVKDEEEECQSTGCMPAEWSDCVCEPGANVGTQTGTCTDNCDKELEFEQSCECEIDEPPPSQGQTNAGNAIEDAEDAIEQAEDEGKDVSAAEQKLEQAQEAFDSGNYDLAKELAEEAEVIANEEERPWWEDINIWIIVVLGFILGLLVLYIILDKLLHKPEPPVKPIKPSGEEKV